MRRRLSIARRWLLCRAGVHRWYYFIDGYICRRCTTCDTVQYDLGVMNR